MEETEEKSWRYETKMTPDKQGNGNKRKKIYIQQSLYNIEIECTK